MTTRQLVDPELVAMLDQFPPLLLSDETLEQIRVHYPTKNLTLQSIASELFLLGSFLCQQETL